MRGAAGNLHPRKALWRSKTCLGPPPRKLPLSSVFLAPSACFGFSVVRLCAEIWHVLAQTVVSIILSQRGEVPHQKGSPSENSQQGSSEQRNMAGRRQDRFQPHWERQGRVLRWAWVDLRVQRKVGKVFDAGLAAPPTQRVGGALFLPLSLPLPLSFSASLSLSSLLFSSSLPSSLPPSLPSPLPPVLFLRLPGCQAAWLPSGQAAQLPVFNVLSTHPYIISNLFRLQVFSPLFYV